MPLYRCAPIPGALVALMLAVAGCGGGGDGGGGTPTQPPASQTLTVTPAGTGAGSVSSAPAGIACTASAGSATGTCRYDFGGGTTVTLTATPAPGHAFTEWGGACTGGTCVVTLTQARDVTATFTPVPVATVAVTPAMATLDVGQTVTLTAAAVAADNTLLPGRAVTWTTSNAAAATVSDAGVVTAVAPADTVRITATIDGKTAAAAVLVRAPVVTVAATDASASEAGPDPGAFTITRTGPTTAALAVAFTLGGTAASGPDYAAVASPVTIPPGQTSVAVPVTPAADAVVEGNETVVLTLAAGAGYAVGTPSAATVTIADAIGPPGVLNNGQLYAGRLSRAGQVDTWTFTATAGDYVIVGAGNAPGTTATVPWVRLVGPTGTLLDDNAGSGAAQVSRSVSAAGTYTVLVASYGSASSATGDYRLTLAKSRAEVVVSDGDEGGPMTNGANLGGAVAAGDLDVWTFSATAGDYVIVGAGNAPGSTATVPWVRLIGPTGELLADNAGSGAAQVARNVPAGGTYTVVVSSYGSALAAAGSYRLTLAKGPGAVAVSTGDEGGPMTNGANHGGRLAAGDLDVWTFTAAGGDYVIVGAGNVPGTTATVPWVRLISPTGALLGDNAGSGAAQVGRNVPVAGTYTVVVGSYGSALAAAGDYRLTLAKGPGAVTVSAGDQGGPVTNGLNYAGSLTAGDLDVWTVAAGAGDYVAVALGNAPGSTATVPWVRLIGPTGELLADDAGSGAAQVGRNVPVEGTYTVVVGSYGSALAAAGDYRLTVAKGPGAVAVSPGDEGGPMANAVNYTGSLTAGDLDVWTFTANAGASVTLSLGNAPGTTATVPWLRLISPTGVLLGDNAGSGTAQISRTVPVAGTYTVLVGSYGSALGASGNYVVSVSGASASAQHAPSRTPVLARTPSARAEQTP